MRIEMAHHPQVILDTMEQIDQGTEGRKRGPGWGGAAALALLGLLVFFLDLALGYGRLFTTAACVLWGVTLALVVMMLTTSSPRFPRTKFEHARQILHTLRDDTGRKGRVVGWLDLTQQKRERTRMAYSTSGKRKEYFRDPWFQVKIKLVDGNLLRLCLEDRTKSKGGYVMQSRTRFDAKLVVNPNLYRVGSIPSESLPLSNATLSSANGIFTIRADFGQRIIALPVAEILETLKVLYSHLELGTESPGKEA